jgi:uncharacterized membrane protein HdeD (DUF308 family)
VIATGALTFVLGVVFMLFPGAGAVSLVWLIGGYLVVFGVLLIAIGWKLRGILRALEHEVRGLRGEPRTG